VLIHSFAGKTGMAATVPPTAMVINRPAPERAGIVGVAKRLSRGRCAARRSRVFRQCWRRPRLLPRPKRCGRPRAASGRCQPRGGYTLSSFDRSSSQIARSASAVALASRLGGSVPTASRSPPHPGSRPASGGQVWGVSTAANSLTRTTGVPSFAMRRGPGTRPRGEYCRHRRPLREAADRGRIAVTDVVGNERFH
jgi:hypothetical protein